MRNKLHQANKHSDTSSSKNLDTLLEEYMSKLEQKVVTQTQQLKTITDNASSCLFMLDKKGVPTFMNPSAEHTTGYTLDEINGQEIHSVLHYTHPDGVQYHPENCPVLVALKGMQRVKDQEDNFIRKDGSVFPISFSLAPLEQEGQSVGAVLEFQDITKRKELERQKDDFMAIVSHELKTPVTSLKAFAQVLQNRFAKAGDEKSAIHLGKMDAQINKLTALIADLLDVSKIEGRRLQFHDDNFYFDELVKEVIEEVQRTTTKHKIILSSNARKMIRSDRERIGQVITNYLTNAIKYSPQSDKIIVKTVVDQKNITLCVQDFGVGIPKEKQPYVFNRFYRETGQEEITFPGLGLGLFIAKEIIIRQGGEVWVKSTKGKGSAFYFTLSIH